ncbi:hypothetical protein B566_EDAN019497, partial [Ephemera danica]
MPKEQELYEEYARIATALAPYRVTFRTLDVGADKVWNNGKEVKETNPALGLRSIRYCMRHQDIFRRQMRAILRASAHGNVAIMFPMISGVTELRLAKSLLNESRQELDAAGIPFAANLSVGIMIELPSAVFTANDLAAEYTQLIARRTREAGVYSEILPCTASMEQIQAARPTALILSGGPDSVGDPGAPGLHSGILTLGVPVLGICYGMQLLAHVLGGTLGHATDREYGPAPLTTSGGSLLWQGLAQKTCTVWMSHGDRVTALPPGFVATAATPTL